MLTEPSLLALTSRAAETSPTLRGLFVRELLCIETPPPPPDVNTALAERAQGVTKRAQLELHMSIPSCAGCHQLIDPIGFGLEHFDALGYERTLDNGQPVSAEGDLLGVPFRGARELSRAVAARPEFSPCMVRKLWTHALGREPTTSDAGELASVSATFAASPQLIELMLALAQTPAFRRASHPGL